MVEIIGDIVAPSEFILPQGTTTVIDTLSGAALMSGAVVYNTTLSKAEVFTGTAWETITSVAR